MNLICFLLLGFFSFSEGKVKICLPKTKINENTDGIQVEKLLGEAFREISPSVLPSVPPDGKIEFALNNDVIRAKGYVKNIGLVSTQLEISVCTQKLIFISVPTSLILNEIVIHGDEYYLNGTVADIFYIDGKGPLDITIKGLSVSLTNIWPEILQLCLDFDIDVKLQEWKANFGGIMGGDPLLEPTINEIIGDMGPDIVNFLWTSEYDKIAAVIQKIIDKFINPHLGHIDATMLKEANLNKSDSEDCKTYIIPIQQ